MERNTVTTIDQLRVGDRFYKQSDRKKIVWEKVFHATKKTHFMTYRFFAKQDGMLYPEPIKKSTQLIFLRHTN